MEPFQSLLDPAAVKPSRREFCTLTADFYTKLISQRDSFVKKYTWTNLSEHELKCVDRFFTDLYEMGCPPGWRVTWGRLGDTTYQTLCHLPYPSEGEWYFVFIKL